MTATTLTPATRTYGWRTWQDAAREALIAIALALLASSLHSGGLRREVFTGYALLALAIVLDARVLEPALSWASEQSRRPLLFGILQYFPRGGIAYFVVSGVGFDVLDTFLVSSLS